MAASSYMLERELLGSARLTIDANSNSSLMPTSQYPTYRLPYATPAPSPYVNSSVIYHHPAPDNYEPRKALTDVRILRLVKNSLPTCFVC